MPDAINRTVKERKRRYAVRNPRQKRPIYFLEHKRKKPVHVKASDAFVVSEDSDEKAKACKSQMGIDCD